MQYKLSKDQLQYFYQYCNDDTQVEHFLRLVPQSILGVQNVVVDVGGGCGLFASLLKEYVKAEVRIIDADPIAIKMCRSKGLEAVISDALTAKVLGDENVVCFNLILHHMVGSTEENTLMLQKKCLQVWIGQANYLFVNELIYDSYLYNISGSIIYIITRSKFLSRVASVISRFVPSLHANTFGVGVRFRARDEWIALFEQWGFRVISSVKGEEKHVPLVRRLLFIKSFRQDSFILEKLD